MHKPAGHNAVSPYLIVKDAEAALAFIEAVFGAKPSMVVMRPDGATMHAEVRIDDSIVMMGQAEQAQPAHVHVYLVDPDAAMERGLAAGGALVQAMAEQGDGDRRGGLAGPCGTTWWLARHVDASSRPSELST